MYLFARQEILRGDARKTSAWAREVAALASRTTELELSLWAATGGTPLGTFVFSTLVESQAALGAALGRLMADEAFLDLVATGSEQLVAPPEDSLVEIVHSAGGSYARAGVGATVSVVTAEVVPGRFAAAARWGVEVADLLSEITGLPSLFARNVYGPFGGLEWVQTAPDLAAFERAWDQVNKDDRYHEKLEETLGLFVEGSGRRVLERRVA